MFQSIRRQFNATTFVAVVALVFAMTGGAYAAKKYLITSTKQISPAVLKSLQGKNGVPGVQGPAGVVGPPGPAGAQGPKGENGSNGSDGTNGADGARGVTGPAGAAGAKGATGPSGTNGTNGAAGPQGPTGTNGTNGATGPGGATGATGPQGEPGTASEKGATGATGPAGTNGVSITSNPLSSGSLACPEGGSEFTVGLQITFACNGLSGGGGTVTEVATGTGLTGGPITSTGTIAVNPAEVQSRVTGTCSVGEAVTAVNEDGSVTCGAAGGGGGEKTCYSKTTPTLPSGCTETGAWAFGSAVAAQGNHQFVSISFNIPVATKLRGSKTEFVTAATINCPGTVEEPKAGAGWLCIYNSTSVGTGGLEKATYAGTLFNNTTTFTAGGVMQLVIESGAEEVQPAKGWGTWAVTAP